MVNAQEIRFSIIEHEADMGLEIYGKNQGELFMHAGAALFSLITYTDSIEPRFTKQVTMDNDEDSLVVFLNELLYLWDTEQFIPCTFSILEKGGRLDIVMAGDVFDPGKHHVNKEIKAVTYHKFAVQRQGDLLKATIFLDI